MTGAPCVSDAELMFVVSTSGSVDPYYLPQIIEFISNITMSLPVDGGQVRVGVITYGLQPSLDIALGQYSTASDIVAALRTITYHGNRLTTNSKHRTIELLKFTHGHTYIVMLFIIVYFSIVSFRVLYDLSCCTGA